MPHHILLIEDDANIRSFAATVLQSSGFLVVSCETATQGLKNFNEHRPDLIIVDIGLPDGSGIDVCRKVRHGNGTFVPIIFLTAKGDLKTRLEAFEAGAQDYIQKPFEVEELLARVKAHLKIKRSQDQLSQRNYNLELLHRVQQDLSDMLVHDLKTPLTSIKGTLDIIKSRGLISEESYKRLLADAGEAADFMLLMVNDILDIGRSEQSSLPVQISPVLVEKTIEKIKALFKPLCQKRHVEIVSSIDPKASTILTDANLLLRILANLVSNAIKFSPRDQKIEISADVVNNRQRFSVSDHGPGVNLTIKDRLFEKYAASSAQDNIRTQGTGIGLAFCRAAVTALGGSIWIEDRPGGGSRFIFELEVQS